MINSKENNVVSAKIELSQQDSNFIQKIQALLGSTLTGCHARVMTSSPNDTDIQKVLALNEVLIIRVSGATYEIGCCSRSDVYTQIPLTNGLKASIFNSYTAGQYIQDEKHIKAINLWLERHSSSSLKESSVDHLSLQVFDPDPSWGSSFHKDIVREILKPNEYLTRLWGPLSFFHNLSYANHNKFKELNQALNLAMKAIYHKNAPSSPCLQTSAEIDALLLDHMESMRESKLFSSSVHEVYMDYSRSLSTQARLKRTGNQYEVLVKAEYVNILKHVDTTAMYNEYAQKVKELDLEHEKNSKLFDEKTAALAAGMVKLNEVLEAANRGKQTTQEENGHRTHHDSSV